MHANRAMPSNCLLSQRAIRYFLCIQLRFVCLYLFCQRMKQYFLCIQIWLVRFSKHSQLFFFSKHIFIPFIKSCYIQNNFISPILQSCCHLQGCTPQFCHWRTSDKNVLRYRFPALNGSKLCCHCSRFSFSPGKRRLHT